MFINKKIYVKSGNGGNGKISFSNFKGNFIPDGGDGGDGGDVFVLTNEKYKFLKNNVYFSENGKNGNEKNKKGKRGKNIILKVPLGAILEIKKTKIFFTNNNFFIKILNGGKGGKGNNFFNKNFYSKIASYGAFGKIIFINFFYFFFIKNCFINLSNNFINLNNFNYKKNFISKIYVFFLNINIINIFYKIIKFFLFFLYIKNSNFNNYWVIINVLKNNNLNMKFKFIFPIFFVSNIFLIGFKKFFHYLKIWKNS